MEDGVLDPKDKEAFERYNNMLEKKARDRAVMWGLTFIFLGLLMLVAYQWHGFFTIFHPLG